MKILLGIIAICVLAFTGSRWSFSHFHLPRFAVQLYLTGSEFILVGFLLGPMFLNALDARILISLHPIRAICLGWIGFLFGIQFDRKVIRQFPRGYLLTALFIPAVVVVVITGPLYIFMKSSMGLSGDTLLSAVLVLSFIAANSAPSSLAIFQKTFDLHRSPLLTMFRFIAGIDSFPGILITGIVGALISQSIPGLGFIPAAFTWFAIATMTGVIMGTVLVLLMDTKPDNQEVFVYLTGIIVLIGGFGFYFHQSCLHITAIVGIIAAMSHHGERLHDLAIIPERTIYIILLILAASSIDPHSFHLPLITVYLMFRLAGKMIGGSLAATFWGRWPLTHRSIGLGLLSEGGMSVAMAMTLTHIMPGMVSDTILGVILITVLIHEIVTPYSLQYVFTRAGKL